MECWGLSKRKSWLYWSLLLMMIQVLMFGQTQGDCTEDERKALLEIKASHMKSFDSENYHFLPTWVDYDGSTPGDGGGDCCDWERVSCNTTTGHVTELSLYYLRELDPNWGDESKLWALNVSLFLDFKELRNLNLSYNFLDRETMQTGLGSLSSLTKLEVLDLSWNYDIVTSHFSCSPLLCDIAFTSFHRLRVLDLSHNNFVGSIPSAIQALSSLQVVSFASNNLNGSLSTGKLYKACIAKC